MASALEVIGEAFANYWTSSIALTIVAVCGASMVTLLYVFLANARNTKLRVSLLTAFYGLTIFFWLFVAASFVLCTAQARMVAYRTDGVRVAATISILVALVAAFAVSAFVWRRAPRALLRRFAPRELQEEEAWVQAYADLVADFEGVPRPKALLVESEGPLAVAIGGRDPKILLSIGLLKTLDREEIETVVAHELMHLKHHDAQFKVFSTVLSRILFFDPFSKFFDPAVHREREYLADEMSGRSTGKPAALASALLKIAGNGVAPKAAWGLSILGPGKGVFSRYPPLKERVHRLLLLSDLLRASGQNWAKG